MPFMGQARGKALTNIRPRVLKTGDKMGLPRDAYYVLTKAEASLANSKIHPNSGAPNYNIVHNTSDLTGDTDDLDEGTTNLYFTDARVETISDTLYLRLDAANSPITGNVVINGTFEAGATTLASLAFPNLGSIINFGSGDITQTYTANTLTFAGINSFDVGTANILTYGAIYVTDDSPITLNYNLDFLHNGSDGYISCAEGNLNITSATGIIDFGSTPLETTGTLDAGNTTIDGTLQVNEVAGIGTAANANVPLSVVGATIPGGYVQIRMASSIADNANKAAGFSAISYDLDEPDIALLFGSATATTSSLEWGGGNVFLNAATSQNFYTAANSTTLAGTKRLEITPAGDFDFKTGDLKVGGDFYFAGAGSGLAFGCIEGLDETVTCTTQNTWYQVTFDTVASENLTTVSTANNDITILKAGVYNAIVTACFHSTVSHDFELMIKKNNGTVDVGPHLFQTTAVSNRVENSAGSCHPTFAIDDTAELWVRCTDAGGINAIFDHVGFNITQIGGV